ncbi:MAG: ABC transporter permease subunit [Phycisphaera sp.]|nr:ABC transporter permease subunit [Phycisphaera sp.]
MNDAASIPSTAPAPPRASSTRRQTYMQRVLSDTFVRWGARLGLAWIVVLTFLAIFAPLVANSRPLLIKMDGEWSSPMIKSLTPLDIALLLGFFVAAIAYFIKSVPAHFRALAVLAVVLLTWLVAWLSAGEPPPEVYETYRVAEREGRVQFVINAPIPYSPRDRLRDQPGVGLVAPWWAWWETTNTEARRHRHHWLGNEANNMDMASRMIHACRVALSIGFVATGIAMVIGIVLGGFMGYFSRAVDLVGMRLVEVFEFIPSLYLILICVAFFGRNIYFIMVILGLTGWTGYARFTRAEFLRLRNQDFVLAAQACGLPLRSILFRHMLPNGIGPILVTASFGVASAILYEATLSFLNVGDVQRPSWGELLYQALQGTGSFTWWIAIFPGFAIFMTVFAYNLIGESLRDAIDPHMKKSSHL